MKIYFYDNAAPTRDWASLVQGTVVPQACTLPLGGNAFHVAATTIVAPSCVVMHDSMFDAQHKWTILTGICATSPNIAFILVSGGEIKTASTIPTNLCVYRAAVANGTAFLTDPFVVRFARWYARAQKPTADTLDWGEFDPEQGQQLALKLLCEAYTMPADASGSRSYQPTTTGAKPITVHCPDPSTWFDLLGASKPANDRDEAAITAFGRLMGDVGDAAMNLARAIVRPGSDISGPAGKFVEKVSEITAVQTGGAK